MARIWKYFDLFLVNKFILSLKHIYYIKNFILWKKSTSKCNWNYVISLHIKNIRCMRVNLIRKNWEMFSYHIQHAWDCILYQANQESTNLCVKIFYMYSNFFYFLFSLPLWFFNIIMSCLIVSDAFFLPYVICFLHGSVDFVFFPH